MKELKAKLKASEKRCNDLYEQMMNSNNKGMERWQDIQVKYEESQAIITKQLKVIDDLNKQIVSLKEVNNQIEYSWNCKYVDDLKKKEDQILEIQRDNQNTLIRLKDDHAIEIRNLKLQFRDDVLIIDKELSKQI